MACRIVIVLCIGLVLLASPGGATNATNTTNATNATHATNQTNSAAMADSMRQQFLENTVVMFEDQPTISQEISKDFLFAVIGHNMGTDVGAGGTENVSLHLMKDISLFDKNLNQLINGDAANGILSVANMEVLVQNAVKALSDIWVPLKALIELQSNGIVGAPVLLQFATESKKFLSATENVVDKLVTSASNAGGTEEPVVVTTARRQTMLMHKMAKEVLLIALGVEVAQHLADLQETATIQIGGANRGLILGARWAKIPRVTKICTLAQMRNVTNKLAIIKPFIDEIIGAGVNNSQAVAIKHANNVVEAEEDLAHDMEVAVSLYVHDNSSCDILSGMTNADWWYLVNLVAGQRAASVRLGLQVLQVANDVAIETSKVDITIKRSIVTSALRNLIEGNDLYSSPPTQQIVDQIFTAYTVWQEYSAELETVIFTDVVDALMVDKTIRLSQEFLELMNNVMTSYRALVRVHDPSVPEYLIHLAGRQRMFFQRLAFKSNEVKFYLDNGIDPKAPLDDLNTTRDTFLRSHYELLEGDPANNLTETTDLCIINKMKEVKDAFDQLLAMVVRVANGEKPTSEMIDLTVAADTSLNAAFVYFSEGVPATCPDVQEQTLGGWGARIIAAGYLRTSSQKTCVDWLWSHQEVPGRNPGVVPPIFLGAAGIVGEGLVNAVRKLRFGWGMDNLPTPYNDKMRQELADVNAALVEEVIHIPLDDADKMAGSTDLMFKASQALVSSYVSQSNAAFPSLPSNRIELSTRLAFLANKMAKEALIIRRQGSRRLQSTMLAGHAVLAATTNSFRQVMNTLANGDPSLGVPAVLTPERDDIKFQQARIAAAFAVFQPNIACVANPGCRATLTTRDSIDDLELEIEAAHMLYMQEDPIVEEVYSWTLLIYVVIGVLVVAVMGFGCYRGLRAERSEKRASSADAGSA